jgi:hypothetical protein
MNTLFIHNKAMAEKRTVADRIKITHVIQKLRLENGARLHKPLSYP